jgi:hypothetical protein
MTGPTYTGTLVGSDGSKLIIRDGELVPADTPPTPPPAPVLVPDGANTVRAAGSSYPLAGVNPTRVDYPGGRGPDELVAYVAPTTVTATNAFGSECTVMAGQVIAAVDRQATKQSTGVIVPVGGVVLSGHGRARDWLNRYAVRGTPISFTTEQPTPPPVPAVPTTGGRTVALYLKDGAGKASDIPAAVTQVRIAFAQGDPPKLTDWGGESTAATIAGLNAWRTTVPGRQVLVSVGGAGGKVNLSNRGGFLAGILAMEQQQGLHLDGIDFDLEGSAVLNPADVVAIVKSAAAGREASFVASFAPPGGNPVGPAIAAAVELHRAGFQVQVGQQLYEGPSYIDVGTALGALGRAVSAGLPPECVLLGTMVGSDSRHWTIDVCEQVLRAAVAKWPTFGGAYLWSERYSEDDEWARRMAAVLASG